MNDDRANPATLPATLPGTLSGARLRSDGWAAAVAIACTVLGGSLAHAQSDALEQRVERLEEQARLTERQVSSAERSRIKWHLSGYTDTGFEVIDIDGDRNNTFTPISFSPIFHFLYDDLVLGQAETNIALEEDGSTEIELEYANLGLYLHDRVAVVAGSFLSPIGQFQERLHPSWINKLPSTPVGYEHHGGIAPATDLGVQLRGGTPVGDALVTYVAYAGNGPRLVDHHGRLEVVHEAAAGLRDQKAVGGRFAIVPVPHVEIGSSVLFANNITGDVETVSNPDYRLWGVDAAYTQGPWDMRLEYLNTRLDGFFDGEGARAPATEPNLWYAQVAHRMGNWESVARYGELDNETWNAHQGAVTERETKRSTLGINYLFRSSLIAKLAFEHDDRDWTDDVDRFLVELAYGF